MATSPPFRPHWSGALTILLLTSAALWLPAHAQKPPAKEESRPPDERAAPEKDKETQDRLAQAKLELRILEGRMAVKQAELEVEDERLRLAQMFKNNADDQARKKIIAPATVEATLVDMLDQEARVIAKRAEFDEATARYELAKQRLTDGKLPPPDPTSGRLAELERRLAEVEQKVSRLIVRVEGIDRYKLKQ